MTAPSDEALMIAARDGDLSRFSLLFERHQRAMFQYFCRMQADRGHSEDLVQEVFLRALRYRRTYREHYPFTAWMYQIARNVWKDNMPDRRQQPLDDRAANAASRSPGPEERAARDEQARILRRALEELPEDKREVLILSRYQGLSYDEISAILGCEINTVKTRVFRAVRSLSEIYQRLQAGRSV